MPQRSYIDIVPGALLSFNGAFSVFGFLEKDRRIAGGGTEFALTYGIERRWRDEKKDFQHLNTSN